MDISGDTNFLKLMTKKLTGGGQWNKNKYIDPHQFIPENYKKLHVDYKEIKTPIIKREDIPDRLPYEYKPKMSSLALQRHKVTHNGQRKLFLSELQHLIAHLNKVDEEVIVIYAGAAPSNKANVYAKLFTGVKFIFIDPNEFNIYMNKFHDSHYGYPGEQVVYMSVSSLSHYELDDTNNKKNVKHYKKDDIFDKYNVKEFIGWDEESMIDFILSTNYRFYLFEEYMTQDVAKSFNKLIKKFNGKVLFWSDIRTNFKTTKYFTEDNPTDTDIIANTAMNYVWLKELIDGYSGELYSMLKFRLPYMDDEKIEWNAFDKQLLEAKQLGADYEKILIEHNAIKWFKGDIYLQAFPHGTSAESRLWSTIEQLRDDLVVYPLKDHEEPLFYYNIICRFGWYFDNPFADRNIGFDHCNDCAIEATIWSDFYDKYYPSIDFNIKRKKIIKHVVEIGSITGRNLMKDPHGHQYPHFSKNIETLIGGRFVKWMNRKPKKEQNKILEWDINNKISPISLVPADYIDVWKEKSLIYFKDPVVKLDMIDKRLKYNSRVELPFLRKMMRTVIHNGQRKLFLTELQHLTECLDSLNEEAMVIYAGSAPSNKSYMYAKLFPNVKFVYIDPNEFDIYINPPRDSHYNYPGDYSVYMYVSSTNADQDRESDFKKRLVVHYKDTKKVIDKEKLNADITHDDKSMIDYILSTNHRFYLFEEYMTPQLSRSLNKLIKKFGKKVLFWNDARTSPDDENNPSDIDIIGNTAMYYTWAKELVNGYEGEFYSMLKFRPPWFDANINDKSWGEFNQPFSEAKQLGNDFFDDYKKKIYKFFKGDIYIQAFAGNRSTEVRLWSNKEQLNDHLIEYDYTEHEEKLYYYNVVYRFGYYFTNISANRIIGFDHCGDCALEGHIWYRFFKKFYPDMYKIDIIENISKKVLELCNILSRSLMKEPHGHHFDHNFQLEYTQGDVNEYFNIVEKESGKKITGGSLNKRWVFRKPFVGTGIATQWRSNNKLVLEHIIPEKYLDIWMKEKKDEYKYPVLLFEDIPHRLEYDWKVEIPLLRKLFRYSNHNGQKKKLLSEVQHLTACLDSYNEPALVIYIGAAPNHKGNILAQMFPRVKFICIDPVEYNIHINSVDDSQYDYPGQYSVYMNLRYDNINLDSGFYKNMLNKPRYAIHYKNTKNIINKKLLKENLEYDESSMIDFILKTNYNFYLFEEEMDYKLAVSLNKLIKKWGLKTIMWSDIKTNPSRTVFPSNVDVVGNTAMNYVWSKILSKDFVENDFYAMCTFRTPWFDMHIQEWDDWDDFQMPLIKATELGHDFYKDFEERKYKFFKGDRHIQVFGGNNSTELKLWYTKKEIDEDLVEYDAVENEDKFHYFNYVYRYGYYFKNDYTNRRIGFDHCNDCSVESIIWSDYYKKYFTDMTDEDIKSAVLEKVNLISNISKMNLMKEPHGHHFDDWNIINSDLLGGDNEFEEISLESLDYWMNYRDEHILGSYEIPAKGLVVSDQSIELSDYIEPDEEYALIGGVEPFNDRSSYYAATPVVKWFNRNNIRLHNFINETMIEDWKQGEPEKIRMPFYLFDKLKKKRKWKYPEKFTYIRDLLKYVVQCNERKLYTAELQYLTAHIDDLNDKAIVIYIGAAPFTQAYSYAKYFPNIKFICIDPAEFNILIDIHLSHYDKPKSGDVIYMYINSDNINNREKKNRSVIHYKHPNVVLDKNTLENDIGYDEKSMIDFILSTDYKFYIIENVISFELTALLNKLIKKYKGKVLFWDDIHTVKKGERYPSRKDGYGNLAITYSTVKDLIDGYDGYFAAMFKLFPFKIYNAIKSEEDIWDDFIPYLDRAKELGHDFINDYENLELYHFNGKNYIQVFGGSANPGTKLWCTKKDIDGRLKKYDMTEIDDKFYQFHSLDRFGYHYKNNSADFYTGLDNCYDCAVMCKVIEDFYHKFYPDRFTDRDDLKTKINGIVEQFSMIIGNSLRTEPHGHNIYWGYENRKIKGGKENYVTRTAHFDLEKLSMVWHRYRKPIPLIEYIDERHIELWKQEKPEEMKKVITLLSDLKHQVEWKYPMNFTFMKELTKLYSYVPQRRLFLTELQHLTATLDNLNDRAIVIYAGAAPCRQLYSYAKYFKNVKFILIDPNEFDIYINGYMDSHYNHPDMGIMYMHLSHDNEPRHVKQSKIDKKLVSHYKNPSKVIDKDKLKKDKTYDTESMIKFILKGRHKIYIFEKEFDFDLLESLTKLVSTYKHKVIFWCDVRTRPKTEKYPNLVDRISWMAMGYTWAKTLSPKCKNFSAMFGFGTPYISNRKGVNVEEDWTDFTNFIESAKDLGHDYLKDEEDKKIFFFKGDNHIMPFGSIGTFETKLWATKENIESDLVEYNHKEYSNTMHYFNYVVREGYMYENLSSNLWMGFDHCYDCALENHIWFEYYKKFHPEIPHTADIIEKIRINVEETCLMTDHSLKIETHGHKFTDKERETLWKK